MITEDQLAADKAAVATAQQALEKDQAAYDAVQPHLTLLAELESYSGHLEQGIREGFLTAITKFRSLL